MTKYKFLAKTSVKTIFSYNGTFVTNPKILDAVVNIAKNHFEECRKYYTPMSKMNKMFDTDSSKFADLFHTFWGSDVSQNHKILSGSTIRIALVFSTVK